MSSFSIVVPTVGRPSLQALLDSLAACEGPRPEHVVLVDDRRDATTPLTTNTDGWLAGRTRMLRSEGRGPAAARNVGWRAVTGEWVVFLDDDVLVEADWLRSLEHDLAAVADGAGGDGSDGSGSGADVAAVQGHIRVPRPDGRAPTDWERGTRGLENARWITADIAYRRDVLEQLRGFDERFPRAFREDADLALRAIAAGHRLVVGTRRTTHPVRPARWHVSIAQQRGNADDALMRELHGRDWSRRAGAPVGRQRWHVATVASAGLAAVAAARGHRTTASAAAACWTLLTGEFAWTRIAPGPRNPREVATMLATSVAIPPTAVTHLARGTVRHRHAPAWSVIAPPSELPAVEPQPVEAVLLDRDGTLVRDVRYNGRPDSVVPLPGVVEALHRLRSAGLRLGVVTNQSGIDRGLVTREQVESVNRRVAELLGPFDTWQVCPHAEPDGCDCRNPASGMIRTGADELGVPVERCAVVGDTGSDIAAGVAAGAGVCILVPTAATRPEEVAAAPLVFGTLAEAADELVISRSRSVV